MGTSSEDDRRHGRRAPDWVFVAHEEVGLLDRLRRVVGASSNLVLVRLEAGASAPGGAQAGVATGAGTAWWFRSLSAADTAALLEWLSGARRGLPGPPAALRRRVVAAQRAPLGAQRLP